MNGFFMDGLVVGLSAGALVTSLLALYMNNSWNNLCQKQNKEWAELVDEILDYIRNNM